MRDEPTAAGPVSQDETATSRTPNVVRFPLPLSGLPADEQTTVQLLTDIARALGISVDALLEPPQPPPDHPRDKYADQAALVAAFQAIRDPVVQDMVIQFVQSCADRS